MHNFIWELLWMQYFHTGMSLIHRCRSIRYTQSSSWPKWWAGMFWASVTMWAWARWRASGMPPPSPSPLPMESMPSPVRPVSPKIQIGNPALHQDLLHFWVNCSTPFFPKTRVETVALQHPVSTTKLKRYLCYWSDKPLDTSWGIIKKANTLPT